MLEAVGQGIPKALPHKRILGRVPHGMRGNLAEQGGGAVRPAKHTRCSVAGSGLALL